VDDFLARFMSMVDELLGHPRVRVTHLWFGAGASGDEIARIESALGQPMGEALRALYRQANGLQLRWLDVANPTYVPARDDRMCLEHTPGLGSCDDLSVDGLLDILPAGPCLVDNDYRGQIYELEDDGGTVTLASQEYPRGAFLRQIRPFDEFGEYGEAALFLGDRVAGPWMVLGEDYRATYTDSGKTTVASYLEHVLQTRASVRRRHLPFSRTPPWDTVSRGPCVPVDTLLSKRRCVEVSDAVGRRVFFEHPWYSDVAVGKVVSVHAITSPPRDWTFTPELLRVEMDLGQAVYVPVGCATLVDERSTYEQAHHNATSYFERLRGLELDAQWSIVASLYGPWMRGTVRHQGSALAVPLGSWRFVGWTSGLSPAEAVLTSLDLALRFAAGGGRERPLPAPELVDDVEGGPPRRAQCIDLVQPLVGAAALHVARAHQASPMRNLADGLGPTVAERVLEAHRTLQAAHLGHVQALHYLRDAVNAPPGALVLPEAGLRGSRLGLEDLLVTH
jgi:hypothetical protein